MMKNKKRKPKSKTKLTQKTKSKIKSVLFITLPIVLLILTVSPVLAESGDGGTDAIAITVIVPPVAERPTPLPATRRVYPINVAEGYNFDGVRELVRVYELQPDESPEWIETDSFTRNGYYYQLAEITRRVDVAHTVREHTEIIEIPTENNDLAAVIAGLEPTMDFIDDEGYVGLLHLDIRSIEMTQDGTRSTSRTVSETRQYPHLSSPDLSLVPQTLEASGRTFTLADVEWRANTSTVIDYNSVPQTYTAHATYTRTATSTVATGYTTKASYSGTLTRVSTGDVRFVATFIGTPVVSPIVNRPASSSEQQDLEQQNHEQPSHEQESEPSEVIDAEQGEAEIDISPSGNEIPESDMETLASETEMPIVDITDNDSKASEDEPDIAETEEIQEQGEDERSGNIPHWFLFLAIPVVFIIAALVALMLKFKNKADAWERNASIDSADALYSRMASIVKRDRKEISEYEDEYESDVSDEDSDEDENFDEDSDFESVEADDENFDEDSDEDEDD